MLEIEHDAAATGRAEGGDHDQTDPPHVRGISAAAAAATGAGLGFPMPALAQGYPARPVTVIVPWGAGGGTDATARIVAALLEKDLGQPFNVVNRTGGSGVVGHSGIATGAPDGYTIGMITVEITMMHWQGLTELNPKSYTPLALMNEDPPGVTVNSSSPYKTMKELADAIKAAPAGKMKASGTGQGGIWHLALVGWLKAMGLAPNHVAWVPSNGAAPAMQDLAAGGLDLCTCSIPEARAIIEAGKARALALMGPERNPVFKDIPTLKEAMGIDYSTGAWRGIAGPKGLPAGCRHQAHRLAEEGLGLEGVQGLHEQPRLRRGVGRRRAVRELHGQGRRADGRRHEGRWAREEPELDCFPSPRIAGRGEWRCKGCSCVCPIASRVSFSSVLDRSPHMAAGCCRRCPASPSGRTCFRSSSASDLRSAA